MTKSKKQVHIVVTKCCNFKDSEREGEWVEAKYPFLSLDAAKEFMIRRFWDELKDKEKYHAEGEILRVFYAKVRNEAHIAVSNGLSWVFNIDSLDLHD